MIIFSFSWIVMSIKICWHVEFFEKNYLLYQKLDLWKRFVSTIYPSLFLKDLYIHNYHFQPVSFKFITIILPFKSPKENAGCFIDYDNTSTRIVFLKNLFCHDRVGVFASIKIWSEDKDLCPWKVLPMLCIIIIVSR